MNMQMSPASLTHSLRDVDLIGYKVVCDVRMCVFETVFGFKEEILSNAVHLWTYTWFKRIKNTTYTL